MQFPLIQLHKSLASLLRAFERLFAKSPSTPAPALEPLEARALFSATLPTQDFVVIPRDYNSPIIPPIGPSFVPVTKFTLNIAPVAVRGTPIHVQYSASNPEHQAKFIPVYPLDRQNPILFFSAPESDQNTPPPSSSSSSYYYYDPQFTETCSFYLDTDNDSQITDADTLIASDLPAKGNGSFTYDTTNLPLGQHTILGRLNPTSDSPDPLPFVDMPSGSFTLYRTAVSTPSPGNKSSITYIDSDQNTVKATLTGPGSLLAYFLTEDSQPGDASILQVIKSLNSSLSISVTNPNPADTNPITQIQTITSEYPQDGYAHLDDYPLGVGGWNPPRIRSLRSINAPSVDITGSFEFRGHVGSATFHDLTGASFSAVPNTGITLNFHDITDSSIRIWGDIASFKLNSWSNSNPITPSLIANSITSLLCQGDFSLSLTIDPQNPARLALGNINIKGSVTGSWDIAGNTNSLTIGSAQGWSASFQRVNSITLGKSPSNAIVIQAASINSFIANSDVSSLSINFNPPSATRLLLNRFHIHGDATSLSLYTPIHNTRFNSITIDGNLTKADISLHGSIGAISAYSIDTVSIVSYSLGSLRTFSDASHLTVSDARSSTIYGVVYSLILVGVPAGIGSIAIGRLLTDSYIQTPGNLSSIHARSLQNTQINVDGHLALLYTTPVISLPDTTAWGLGMRSTGDIAGTITAGSIGSIRSSSTIQANITSFSNINAIYAAGSFYNCAIVAENSIYAINVDSIYSSTIRSGSALNHPNALIASITVRYRSTEAPSFVNSLISGARIGRISLRTVDTTGPAIAITATRSIARIAADNLPTVTNMLPASSPVVVGNVAISVTGDPVNANPDNFPPYDAEIIVRP